MKEKLNIISPQDIVKSKVKYRPSAVKGTTVAELVHPNKNCPVPLGNIWYTHNDDVIAIMMMFVAQGIRRMGISSKILDKMIKRHRPHFVVTPAGTNDDRLQWEKKVTSDLW